MRKMIVELEQLEHARGLPIPDYMTEGASGVDLVAAVEEPVSILPGKTALIPTGLKMAIPSGFEGQVRTRSGLALKHGLVVLNSPGTIDSDYRGEVKVIVINLGDKEYIVQRGERVAQMVFCRTERVDFEITGKLDSTTRGEGGFGHTGKGGQGCGSVNWQARR